MHTTTQPRFYKPVIPLVDPDTGKKVKLRLRKMSFEQEIRRDLPADMKKLHEIIFEARLRGNSDDYIVIGAWNRLRIYDRYWESFGQGSEEEYLAAFGLPDGQTLLKLTAMVELFEEATFVLLGDRILGYMMRAIEDVQEKLDQRKRDYQAILDAYCSKHTAFDKKSFFDTVKWYVEKRYQHSRKPKRDRSVSKGTVREFHARRPVEADPRQQEEPQVRYDRQQEIKQCSECVRNTQIIKEFQQYTRRCQKVIREKIGDHAVPLVPEVLSGLV